MKKIIVFVTLASTLLFMTVSGHLGKILSKYDTPIAKFMNPNETESAVISWVDYAGPKRVSADGIASLMHYEGDQMVIIDARDEASYNKGHIKNAINIPTTQLSSLELSKVIPTGQTPVVLYCEEVTCQKAIRALYDVSRVGYTNLHYYQDGQEEWGRLGIAVNIIDDHNNNS